MEERKGSSNGVASKHANCSKSPGEKRNGNESEERSEFESERVKARDLVSEPTASNDRQSYFNGQDRYGVTEIFVSPDADGSDRIGSENLTIASASRVVLESSGACQADINSVSTYNNLCIPHYEEQPEAEKNMIRVEETQYLLNEKEGPVESDSMRRWKEMKRNGFLSNPLGGAAVSSSVALSSPGDMSNQKQQKNKRKKKEISMQEQANRFANIAAPSGLLKELNPGIIKNVRNEKQVRSVFEALVSIGTTEDNTAEDSLFDPNTRGS